MAPIRVSTHPTKHDGLLVKVGNSPFIVTDVIGLLKFITARHAVEPKKDE